MAKWTDAVSLLDHFRSLFHRIGEASPAKRRDGPAEDGEDTPAPSRRLDRLAQGSSHFRAIVVNSIVGFTLIISVATLVREVFRDSALIDPIQVPDSLAKEGYRPEVITQRLMDEVLEIRREAASRREGREIQPEWRQLNIELPGTGISLPSLVRIVKRFFSSSESRVTGEIVVDGDQYELRLRFLGHGVHAEIPSRSKADLGELLQLGAREMMKISDPYILAAYLADSDPEAALKAIVLSLENDLDDDDPWAYTLWGWLLTSEGRYDEAIEKYRAALELQDDFILAASDWGLTLARKGEHDKAIEQYRRTLQWDPNFHAAFNNWGVALIEKGEPEAAIEKFRAALKIDPRFVRAYNNWGAALARQGHHDDALEIYATALDIDPWNAVAHRNWGDALLAKKDYPGAVEKYRRAVELDPDDAHTFLNLGIAQSKLGAYDKAISHFENSVKLNPNLVRAYNSWGVVYYKMTQYSDAEKMYRTAIKIDPNYTPAYRNLGDVLQLKKDPQGAIDMYKQAIEIDWEQAGTHKNLGGAYLKLGDCEQAIQHLQFAIEIDPKSNSQLSGTVRQLKELAKQKTNGSPCK